MAKMPKLGTKAERRERDAMILELSATLSDEEIAERVGINARRVSNRRRALGMTRPNHNQTEPAIVAEIHRLAAESVPPGEIAATVGVSYWTVNEHIGPTESGREWNKVARWAAKHHRALWEELQR